MRRKIILHDKARLELQNLYDYVAERAGATVAWGYVGGLRQFIEGLAEFPERGTMGDGLVPGLRVIGYRRNTSVAFVATASTVYILGIFHGGRLIDDKILLARI